jgi:hypothetical protein
MFRTFLVASLAIGIAALSGCAHKVPLVDLSQADPGLIQRCTDEVGGLIGADDRYLEYRYRGYDITAYKMLSGDKTPVHRRVIKILNQAGAERASNLSVYHYREQEPDVNARAWMEDGSERMLTVRHLSSGPIADWPCELQVPRRTDFRIATLLPGDTVEILWPISGPDTLAWSMGSDGFCLLHAKATFGHHADEDRPDLHAVVVDATGGVKRTSEGESYPMVFEQTRALMPLSASKVPFVLLAPRCPGWKHLRAQLFHLSLYLARTGTVAGRKAVNPLLLKPVDNGEKLRRILATAQWMHSRIQLEPASPLFWMRWMPLQPAPKTATRRRADPGSWSVLAFRILDQAGLKPRFALIHTDDFRPFAMDLPTTSQFDVLAVVVDDENGKSHWLVPGMPAPIDKEMPESLRGRMALVTERWWLERELGGGDCIPINALGFSCQVETPEPVELNLVRIGQGPAE